MNNKMSFPCVISGLTPHDRLKSSVIQKEHKVQLLVLQIERS